MVQVEAVGGGDGQDVALWMPRRMKNLEIEIKIFNVNLLSIRARSLSRNDAAGISRCDWKKKRVLGVNTCMPTAEIGFV